MYKNLILLLFLYSSLLQSNENTIVIEGLRQNSSEIERRPRIPMLGDISLPISNTPPQSFLKQTLLKKIPNPLALKTLSLMRVAGLKDQELNPLIAAQRPLTKLSEQLKEFLPEIDIIQRTYYAQDLEVSIEELKYLEQYNSELASIVTSINCSKKRIGFANFLKNRADILGSVNQI